LVDCLLRLGGRASEKRQTEGKQRGFHP
jgi:hypothetical protein